MSLRMVVEQLGEVAPGSDEEEIAWLVGRAIGGVDRMESLIDGLLARRKVMVDRLTKLIAERGEDKVLYGYVEAE